MKRVKTLICCCCGSYTKGRQWWSRDKGYGICPKCVEWIKNHEPMDAKEFEFSYGVAGVHHSINQEPSHDRMQHL